jgi:hypothetical protein
VRRLDQEDELPFAGSDADLPTPAEATETNAQQEEQQLRQLRSEPVPEPPSMPAHKYERANFREPVKTPEASQAPNPIIRLG